MPEAVLSPIAILSLADDIQRDVTDCQRLLASLGSALTALTHQDGRVPPLQSRQPVLFPATPFLKQGVTTPFTRLRAPSDKLRFSVPWDLKNVVYKCAPESNYSWPGRRRVSAEPSVHVASCEVDVAQYSTSLTKCLSSDHVTQTLPSRSISNLANGHAHILAHNSSLRSFRGALVILSATRAAWCLVRLLSFPRARRSLVGLGWKVWLCSSSSLVVSIRRC